MTDPAEDQAPRCGPADRQGTLYGRVGKPRFTALLSPRAREGDGFECVPATGERGGQEHVRCGRGAVPRGTGCDAGVPGLTLRGSVAAAGATAMALPRVTWGPSRRGQRRAAASHAQVPWCRQGRTAAAAAHSGTRGARGGLGTARGSPSAGHRASSAGLTRCGPGSRAPSLATATLAPDGRPPLLTGSESSLRFLTRLGTVGSLLWSVGDGVLCSAVHSSGRH